MDRIVQWLGLTEHRGVRCPGCGETKGVDIISEGLFKCLHARCAKKGIPSKLGGLRNAVELTRETRKIGAVDAAKLICAEFGLVYATQKPRMPSKDEMRAVGIFVDD